MRPEIHKERISIPSEAHANGTKTELTPFNRQSPSPSPLQIFRISTVLRPFSLSSPPSLLSSFSPGNERRNNARTSSTKKTSKKKSSLLTKQLQRERGLSELSQCSPLALISSSPTSWPSALALPSLLRHINPTLSMNVTQTPEPSLNKAYQTKSERKRISPLKTPSQIPTALQLSRNKSEGHTGGQTRDERSGLTGRRHSLLSSKLWSLARVPLLFFFDMTSAKSINTQRESEQRQRNRDRFCRNFRTTPTSPSIRIGPASKPPHFRPKA